VCCIALLLFSAIIAGKLVGCSNESKGANSIPDTKVDLTPTKEFVLDIPAYKGFPKIYKDAINEFRAQYPDVKVTVNRLGDRDNYKLDQFQKALTNELMAGSGPDIVITDYFTSDLYKTMDTGAFLNLSPIISGDKNFNIDDYNTTVMSAGYYKGGQYIIPVGYTALIRVSEQSGLNKIGFDQKKVTDCTSFVREIVDCLPKAQENPLFTRMSDEIMLTQILRSSGILLVDEKTKTALPDEAAIRAFCEAYQPYYKIDNGDEVTISGSLYDWNSQGVMPFGYPTLNTAWIFYWTYLKSKGGNPMLVVPNSVDGGVHATVTNGVAIRAGSPNQLNAWNFIKILLSMNQPREYRACSGFGYPVNKATLKDYIDSYLTNEHSMISYGENQNDKVDFSVLNAKDIEYFQKTLDRVTSCSLQCKPTESFFTQCMEPYFKGEKDLDSCMEDLKRQLNLYVEE
jgi:ABC-type sugar transport system, periplasmic component